MKVVVALISLTSEREPTILRFKSPQRNLKACFMHLDGEFMILISLTLLN